MIAKLVVYGEDRDAAIEKTIAAIDDYEISGFSTTLGFCRFAIDHPEFRNGDFTINFVGDHFKPEMLRSDISSDVALAAFKVFKSVKKENEPQAIANQTSAWKANR